MRKSLVGQLSEQAAEPEGLSPFDRFSDLTKRLVAVPKAEIAKRQASEQEKPKRTRAVAP